MKRSTQSKNEHSETARGTDEKVIKVILAERGRFHRFVASRVGEAAAEDVLQNSLLCALEQNRSLRRGEAAVPWLYRILRNAISDYYRKTGSESRRVENLLAVMRARGEDKELPPPAEWEKAVCACFRGLLPALKPRYAAVIRRVDLEGEGKLDVARDLKVSRATMDVLLHRARQALRKRLEVFCGSCSREHCLACLCKRNEPS